MVARLVCLEAYWFGFTSNHLHNIEKNYVYNIGPSQRMEGVIANRDDGGAKAHSGHPCILPFFFPMKINFQ